MNTPRVMRLLDVRVKPQRWLYEPFLLDGALTVIAGAPGEGKSLLAVHLAAAVTGGEIKRPVLYSSTEDDVAAVLRARLIAAGAEAARVDVVAPETALLFPEHGEWLAEIAAAREYGLIVLDAFVDHLAARTDTNNDHSVRTAMRPLREVAAATGCAVAAVLHTNKGKSLDPTRRLSGSIGFTGQARVVLMMGHAPGTRKNERVIVQTKTNYSAGGHAARAEITEVTVATDVGPVATARLDIVGRAEADAATILAGQDTRRGSARPEAEAFLRTYLADGARPAAEVVAAARQRGINESALQRAKQALGVASNRVAGAANAGHWVWSLPPTLDEGR